MKPRADATAKPDAEHILVIRDAVPGAPITADFDTGSTAHWRPQDREDMGDE